MPGTILAVYPAAVVFALYCTWLAAWMELGHRPRPMIDDPKFIGGAVDVCYVITHLLGLILLPVLALNVVFIVAGTAYMGIRFACKGELAPRALWPLIIICAAALGGSIVVLWWDPLRVFDWFLD